MVDIVLPRAVGADGATPIFTIGTVTTGTPAVTQTGTALNPVLNFVFAPSGGSSPPYPISDITGLQAALDGKQPLDGDLTAIAALSGTNVIYYRSAADTWSPVTIGANLTFTGGTLAATGGGGGSGDVVGPASAVDGQAALFDGATGKLIKAGGILTGTNTGDQTITLTGEATGSGTGSFAVTLTNASVIGKVITGYSSSAGTVAATDTIVAAIGKLDGNNALKANISDTLNTQTGTTYTLVAADNGRVVELGNAAAITLTAPVLTTGFNCIIRQTGAGQVTVSVSGTTLRNRQSHTKLAGQWAEASISYRATNEFVLSGDTTT